MERNRELCQQSWLEVMHCVQADSFGHGLPIRCYPFLTSNISGFIASANIQKNFQTDMIVAKVLGIFREIVTFVKNYIDGWFFKSSEAQQSTFDLIITNL